jgi:hypothetical protein
VLTLYTDYLEDLREAWSSLARGSQGAPEAIHRPAFILDVTNEYPEFKRVGLGTVFGMD